MPASPTATAPAAANATCAWPPLPCSDRARASLAATDLGTATTIPSRESVRFFGEYRSVFFPSVQGLGEALDSRIRRQSLADQSDATFHRGSKSRA